LPARERSMSTGMERGVAIPHAAVDAAERPLAALAVLPQGVAFESIDGRPATIVALLVIPRREKLLHIRTLAEVARLLSRDEVRSRLLGSGTPEEVLAALREEEAKDAPSR
ncbi:MAG: PTS sugar transporter subunit IIA, partial [Planctomycetota bacterium]